ncbi:hypothetical protein ACS0TY_013225 [Phlomoides rotata]
MTIFQGEDICMIHFIEFNTTFKIWFNIASQRFTCQNCMGELDDSYTNVTIPRADQPLYQNRKGHISVNVLVVCVTPRLSESQFSKSTTF